MESRFEGVPEEIVRGWKVTADSTVVSRHYINSNGDKWSLYTFRGSTDDPKQAIVTRKLVRVTPRLRVYPVYLKTWIFGAAVAASVYSWYRWHSGLSEWNEEHTREKQIKKQSYREGYEEGKRYVTRGLVTPDDIHNNISLLQWAVLQRGENQRRKLEDELRAQYPSFPHK